MPKRGRRLPVRRDRMGTNDWVPGSVESFVSATRRLITDGLMAIEEDRELPDRKGREAEVRQERAVDKPATSGFRRNAYRSGYRRQRKRARGTGRAILNRNEPRFGSARGALDLVRIVKVTVADRPTGFRPAPFHAPAVNLLPNPPEWRMGANLAGTPAAEISAPNAARPTTSRDSVDELTDQSACPSWRAYSSIMRT